MLHTNHSTKKVLTVHLRMPSLYLLNDLLQKLYSVAIWSTDDQTNTKPFQKTETVNDEPFFAMMRDRRGNLHVSELEVG